MKDGWKFYIESVYADTEEDSWEDGLIGGSCSSWTDKDLGIDLSAEFDSVKDVLKYVCAKNGFDFNIDGWEKDDFYEGCFWGDFLVDNNNSEVTEEWNKSLIENWKAGKAHLWNCRVTVHLVAKKVETREFTDEDFKDWNKKDS